MEPTAEILMVGDPPPEVLALRDILSGDGLEMQILARPREARRFLDKGSQVRLLLLRWTLSERDQRESWSVIGPD